MIKYQGAFNFENRGYWYHKSKSFTLINNFLYYKAFVTIHQILG